MIRDLVKIRCCVVLPESNYHGNYHAGSPAALLAPEKQISGYPPAFDSITTLIWISLCRLFFVASSLSPHLARFSVCPDGRPCFRFRDLVGLTVGLAINDAVSMAREVAVGLSGWSLWNELMGFLRC